MTHTHSEVNEAVSLGRGGGGPLGTLRVGLRLYSRWIFKEATYPVKITLSTG